MKKNLFFISCIIGSQSLIAAPITPDEALARLDDGAVPARVRAASDELRLARTVKTASGNPAVYVFTRESGRTLFVSADDLARPLLGFTDSAPCGELPPQLEWWLSEYAREIEQAHPVQAEPRTSDAPKSDYLEITRAPIAPMLTSRWNQDTPYNLMCPKINGNCCYTGCVATAAAQVMYYFKYPDTGTGSISYISNEESSGSGQYHGTLSLDFSSVTFDWDNMLPDYSNGSCDEIQTEAVATLMKAVGYASRMNYGTLASSATVNDCVEGMKTFFGYNKKASLANRSFFSRSAWESLIYSNLQEVGPVLYRGANLLGAGHAFVCDGYADGYFHFNWGWGGYCDGMFSLSALSPDGEGVGGNGTSDYSFDQNAFINLTRPEGRTIDIEMPAMIGYGDLSGSIENQDITLSARRVLSNNSADIVNINPAIKLTNTDGVSQIVKWPHQSPLKPGYGYSNMLFTLPSDLADGTYKAELLCSCDNADYIPVKREVGCTDFVTIVVNGGLYSVENPVSPSYTLSDVELLSPLYLFSDFKVAFKASNDSETEIARGVQPWIYRREAGPTPKYIFTTDRLAMGQGVYLDLMPGESAEVNKLFSMSSLVSSLSSPVQAYLALVNSSDLSILYEIPVTLHPAADGCKPVLDAFSFEGDAGNVNPDDLHFKLKVTNQSGLLAAPVSIGIYTMRGNIVNVLQSPMVFAEAGQTVDVDVQGKVEGMLPDTNYMAYALYYDPKANRYDFMTPTEPLNLHVSKNYTGIATAETAVGVLVSIHDREARIAAQTGLAAIDLYSADGRLLRHLLCGGMSETSVNLPDGTRGIIICRVTLADGSSSIKKIAL